MPKESSQLELALTDCRQQKEPNFKATAARYPGVNRTTLSRRLRGVQRSYIESRSESIQNLTIAQEEVLIDFINRLTNRALPPTSQIVKNVAEELCGKEVGKNWVGQFTIRQSARLHSGYLRSIDNKCLQAENLVSIEKFYDQVSTNLKVNQ